MQEIRHLLKEASIFLLFRLCPSRAPPRVSCPARVRSGAPLAVPEGHVPSALRRTRKATGTRSTPAVSHDHGADVSTQARPSGRTFKVSGLDCAEEVAVLKREIGPLVGGEDRLAFDVLNGRMTVAEAARHVPDRDITAAVKRTGMSASRWEPGRDEDGGDERHRRLQVWFTALSGLSVLIGLVLHTWLAGGFAEALRLLGHRGQAMPLPEIVAYAFAIGFGVRYVLVKAWYAARRLRPDINLLMVIAVAGAIGIGEWFEAATVAFLFALSLTLESWSIGRARRAISALLDLTPPTVRAVSATGEEREIAAATSAGRHALHRPAGRAHRARRPRRRRDQHGRPGADHRRERAGRQGAGRRGVRRHHQRRRRARGREHQDRRGYHARPHHAHGRGRAQPARPGRAVGREVRPRVHARGDRARARDLRRAAGAVRRGVGRLVLPGARPPGDRLPLRARDLDAR